MDRARKAWCWSFVPGVKTVESSAIDMTTLKRHFLNPKP